MYSQLSAVAFLLSSKYSLVTLTLSASKSKQKMWGYAIWLHNYSHPPNTSGKLCRVLSLYIRTENPSWQLVILVRFILEAYGPMCFDIVLYPQVYNGAYHLFNYAKNAKSCLSEELWAKVSKNFERNGWKMRHIIPFLYKVIFSYFYSIGT